MPRPLAAATSATPGSLMTGVPASVMSATSRPSVSMRRMRSRARSDECSWKLISSACEPAWWSSGLLWRVSSAATTATPFRRSEGLMRVDDGGRDFLRASPGFAGKLALDRVYDAPVELAVRADQRGRGLGREIVGGGECARGHRGSGTVGPCIEQRLEIAGGRHVVGFVAEMPAQIFALIELQVGDPAV